ncbi:reverse transcriptase domain-containing protein [Tanacetum coccineum]
MLSSLNHQALVFPPFSSLYVEVVEELGEEKHQTSRRSCPTIAKPLTHHLSLSWKPRKSWKSNGNVVNENVQENVKNVLVNGNREVAVSMSWNDFKLMMIEEFCPSHEMQKLEIELWNHVIVGACHSTYTDRFHKLARLVPHLVTPESRKIERYVYGLAPQIRMDQLRWLRKEEMWGEPSKDKNGRDDNKRTRTRNAFATTANPIGRESTSA